MSDIGDGNTLDPPLPLEIFHVMARIDVATYRNLLHLPFFARSLTPKMIEDFRWHFRDLFLRQLRELEKQAKLKRNPNKVQWD